MEGASEFLEVYTKIIHTIDSCKTLEHIQVTRRMIDNLTTLCVYNSLPYDFYIFYINQLKSLLNKKFNELS
jgi:hypothetical protein